MNTGAMSGRKSAPIRLNESPKYMHWERSESTLPDTPRPRSRSTTPRNSFTYTKEWRSNVLHMERLVSSVSTVQWIEHSSTEQTVIKSHSRQQINETSSGELCCVSLHFVKLNTCTCIYVCKHHILCELITFDPSHV